MRPYLRLRPTWFAAGCWFTPTLLAAVVSGCGGSTGAATTDEGDGGDAAASPFDAGPEMDATMPDAGDRADAYVAQTDTGVDTGSPIPEAGTRPDSGLDSGPDSSQLDANTDTGAGTLDGGQDAGQRDAAPEAGPPACSPTCPLGAACGVSGDCASDVCTNGSCAAPACSPTCASGAKCGGNADCASGVCTNGACSSAACSPSCADGHGCGATSDCASGVCTNGSCAAPACSPTCAFGAACGGSADCASGACVSCACAAPSCSPTCPPGNFCDSNGECASGVCSGGKCQATYTFGGVVAGLTPGESIVLQDQSANPLALNANGSFTMTVPVTAGTPYSVSVATPPSSPIAQTCTVSNGGGTMGQANVTNVAVHCDLLAYYPMDGNANDASGYGNNGVVANAALTMDVAGNANGAYLFAGNGNITVAMPSGFLPYGSASRTMTAWLEPTVGQGEWGIVSYGTGNCTALQFGIGLQNSATFWGGCDDFQSGLAIPVGQWTFVAVVYSSSTPNTMTVYTNGSANVATDTGLQALATPSASNLVIGQDTSNNANFIGAIDSVRIYGHALSAAEVQAVYSSTP